MCTLGLFRTSLKIIYWHKIHQSLNLNIEFTHVSIYDSQWFLNVFQHKYINVSEMYVVVLSTNIYSLNKIYIYIYIWIPEWFKNMIFFYVKVVIYMEF